MAMLTKDPGTTQPGIRQTTNPTDKGMWITVHACLTQVGRIGPRRKSAALTMKCRLGGFSPESTIVYARERLAIWVWKGAWPRVVRKVPGGSLAGYGAL